MENKASDGEAYAMEAKGGNAKDVADIRRMGKSQETRRNFRFISIFGYA